MTTQRRRLSARSHPLVVGHRGDGKGPDENSLGSIERAADAGADAVEIDVRLSHDGRVVVCHDPTLERLTDGRDPRAVASASWRELSAVQLSEGVTLACLEQVLELCRARALGLNVEVKRDVPDRRGVVRALTRVLAAASDGPDCWVSSFDPVMLLQVGRALPRLPRALLVSPDGWRRALAWLTPTLGAVAVHPHHSLVDAAAVRRWHRMGLEVFVWTVNDTSDAERLLDWGVDGLISDRPSAMRALTDRRRTGSARPPVSPG